MKFRVGRAGRRIVPALVLAVALLASACGGSSIPRGAVVLIRAHGDINDVMARYLDRTLGDAERAHASLAVIELDTPGGFEASMRQIVQRIERTTVPVAVWVAPSGARAASAGTFITMAAGIAAMAQGTNIGAASPISSTGGNIGGTLGKKITNDAAAQIRSLAEQHGRNADWAEQAVREAVSITAQQAVQLHVVDFLANDPSQLIDGANGRTALVAGRPEVVRIAQGTPRAQLTMSPVDRFLNLLSDPNLAFTFLVLGGVLLLFELFHPGAIAPGVAGAILLILAFFSLGVLGVNVAGAVLIGAAFVLFVAELMVGGFGALGLGGAVALVVGGLMLTGGSGRGPGVSPWTVVPLALAVAAFFSFVFSALLRARRRASVTGAEGMLGRNGVARTELAPDGYVAVQGERWRATAEDGPVSAGTPVIVVAVEGLRLRVRPRQPAAQFPPPAVTGREQPPEGSNPKGGSA